MEALHGGPSRLEPRLEIRCGIRARVAQDPDVQLRARGVNASAARIHNAARTTRAGRRRGSARAKMSAGRGASARRGHPPRTEATAGGCARPPVSADARATEERERPGSDWGHE